MEQQLGPTRSDGGAHYAFATCRRSILQISLVRLCTVCVSLQVRPVTFAPKPAAPVVRARISDRDHKIALAGHIPSKALMERLTPARRAMLTQCAQEHDPWGQSHLKLVEAGRARDEGAPGHTASKL